MTDRKIKPLDWYELASAIHKRHVVANTIVGRYDVYTIEKFPSGDIVHGWSTTPISMHPAESFEAAKSAAEAHYEALIRSALSEEVAG